MIRDYSFNKDIALLVGVENAVIIHSIMFWITKNKYNNVMLRDGRYWTFNSQKAMLNFFPFFSKDQLKRRISGLVKEGYLSTTTQYSEDGKTYWYSLSDEILEIYKMGQSSTVKFQKRKSTKKKSNNNAEVVEVLTHFNKVAKRQYSTDKINELSLRLITQRLKEGHSVDTLKSIIDLKCKEWINDSRMNKYLRPATLFNKEKFYTYLDELPTKSSNRSSEVQDILRKLTTEFGMKGIRNDESDRLAKQLIELGYKNMNFLNMYLL